MATLLDRRVIRRSDITRIAIGWVAYGLVLIAGPYFPAASLPTPAIVGALALLIAVIIVSAFGVVAQAEAIAHRLGDPYGSLVLTLSIVVIEVVLIAAIMLGPGEHATIARDSVMAVAMIILNLVIGLAVLVGALRHRTMRTNRTGVATYLGMISVLLLVAFALPAMVSGDAILPPPAALVVAFGTIGLYAFFLVRQLGTDAGDFQEISDTPRAPEVARPSTGTTVRVHRSELFVRFCVLVATVIPIVLLSHDMAAFLDEGLTRAGAPIALAGVVIALIVFLPESITAIRAGRHGEAQRVSNLCHGALVSTVGLTIPVVLIIGMLTGQRVELAESGTNLTLLLASVVLSVITFGSPRLRPVHGALHLALFAVFIMTLFAAT